MNIIRHLESKNFPNGCIATIGNFDGVHRGHQKLLQQLAETARLKKLPAVIILFEPQPMEFLYLDKAPARLTRWREKVTFINQLAALIPPFEKEGQGEFNILTLKFNQQLASLTACDFIQQILVEKLKVKHLLIGADFKFGKNRSGNLETLQTAGEQHGFLVETFSDFEWHGRRVSSTRIREALTVGDLNLATDLLGRPYSITGRVIRGAQRGRTIGFPTANIALNRLKCALAGVYAVKIHLMINSPQSSILYGVANLGTRPTVDGTRSFLEVYIFDFNKDIYGQQITVEFVKFLRSEQRFDSLDKLKEQIAKDVETAKKIFNNL